jgi:IS30 family transposase
MYGRCFLGWPHACSAHKSGHHHVRQQKGVCHAITHALEATVVFATAYHAWERGVNENTNGLIRDFFPKGTDFSTLANAEVAKVERLLNARPRKSLGFRSPQEVFDPRLFLNFYALAT